MQKNVCVFLILSNKRKTRIVNGLNFFFTRKNVITTTRRMNPEDDHAVLEALHMHVHKLKQNFRDRVPCVYLLHATSRMDLPIDASFYRYSREDAASALDTSLRSVQFLLGPQFTRCEFDTHLLAGVWFHDTGEVLAHVFPFPSSRGAKTKGARKVLS